MKSPDSGDSGSRELYLDALLRVLEPLVRLLIAKGISYPMVDELLQRAYLDVAQRHYISAGERVTASRLYMLTGIHRKKIGPLLERADAPVAPRASVAQAVLDRWTSDAAFLDSRGRPRPLHPTRREGAERSFEALVEAVSKDIRSRAVLDKLAQGGNVAFDDKGRVCLKVGPADTRFTPGEEAVALERVLRPMAEAVMHNSLQTGVRSAAFGVQITGLAEDVAHELTAEHREALMALLLKFNQKAEKRAAAERKAGRGGDCVLNVGAFEWTDGQSALSRPADAAQVAPGAAPLVKARARRSPAAKAS
jgi:hypothetical protein